MRPRSIPAHIATPSLPTAPPCSPTCNATSTTIPTMAKLTATLHLAQPTAAHSSHPCHQQSSV